MMMINRKKTATREVAKAAISSTDTSLGFARVRFADSMRFTTIRSI